MDAADGPRSIIRNISLPRRYDAWLLARMAERSIGRSEVVRRLIDECDGRAGVHVNTLTRSKMVGHLNAIGMLSRTLRVAQRDPQLQQAAGDIDVAATAIARLLNGELVQ